MASRFSRFGRRCLSTTSAEMAKAQSKLNKTVVIDRARLSPARALFYGDVDQAAKFALPFPQALSKDELGTLEQLVDPVQKYFATIPSGKIDEEHKIPDEVLSELKSMGLFGLQVAEEMGGLGLSNTGYARIVEEIVLDSSVAVTLMAHQSIGFKGLLLFGSEAQKAKYLPKLASGEHIAAFCLTEPTTGSDAASIKLTATPTEDGKAFLLNGQKMWISNGGIAEHYTVFARTPTPDGGSKITAFIVERGFGGITPGQPEKKLGIRGSNTTTLTFDNCRVPIENVLGEVNGGFKVAMGILNNGRFGMGAATGGGLRKLIAAAGEYANQRVQFTMPISKFGLIKDKFARMAVDAYAIEAMAYMTTGLIDRDQLDCSVEAAICKIYGSEAMWRGINECIQILGGMGFASGGAYPFERMMRDTRILLIFEGTNEILRLFVALTCLQGPGQDLRALGKKLQNPATAIAALPELASTVLRTRFGIGAKALPADKITPALAAESAAFSAAVAQFEGAIAQLLMKLGPKVIEPDNQLQVARIANVAIDLYAWLAVLSRASQAAKVGVPALEHEVKLAKAFVHAAKGRINQNIKELNMGPKANGDAAMMEIAGESLEAGKYLAQHPLGF